MPTQPVVKLLVFILCILTYESGLAQEGIEFSEISISEALEKSEEEQKPVFLHATASWSGWCKRLIAEEFSDYELGDYYNEKYINLRFDMEGPNAEKVLELYEVRGYPTLLYIRPDGTFIGAMVGFNKSETLLAVGKQIYGDNPEPTSAEEKKRALSSFFDY